MLRRWIVWVGALTLGQIWGCGSDNSTDYCGKAGDVAQAFKCSGFTTRDAIVQKCKSEQTQAPASCRSKLDAVSSCAAGQPNSSFACSEANDGTIVLKGEFCTSETAAYFACVGL